MTVLTEQEKCNEQLLQQLRDDVAAVTPDPWDKILARVQGAEQPEPETVVPLPQRSRRGGGGVCVGGAWRRILRRVDARRRRNAGREPQY